MKRVLQLTIGETLRGAEKLELDWLKNIDNHIKFDFLAVNDGVFKDYLDEIEKLGGKVYNLNVKYDTFKNKIIYGNRLYRFLKKNHYDIIHINSSAFFFSFKVAIISKLCKVKKVIIHSHSAPSMNKIKRIIISALNPIYIRFFDQYLACSKKAAKALFTNAFIKNNKVKILKNGVEIEKFKFSQEKREAYIKELNLENKIVYGHVGDFVKAKNHMFLIDIFYEIQKKQKNSVLLLLGEGELKEKIKEKLQNLKIEDKVQFLGFRDDVGDILNCIDVFIFPSIYEGFGIAAIEAQTNGLITYCSNAVPEETKISNNFRSFNLNEKANDIATKICNEKLNLLDRKEAYEHTIERGYDIKEVCKELAQIYKEI